MIRRPPRSTLFPTRRSSDLDDADDGRDRDAEKRQGARREAVRHLANDDGPPRQPGRRQPVQGRRRARSEEHTSELQSPCNLVCRLLLEQKKRSASSIPAEKP